MSWNLLPRHCKAKVFLLRWLDMLCAGAFDLSHINVGRQQTLACCAVTALYHCLSQVVGPWAVQEILSADQDLMAVAVDSLWVGRPGPLFLALHTRLVAEREVILLSAVLLCIVDKVRH